MSAINITIENETGQSLPINHAIQEVDVIHEVNRLPMAQLILVDGNASEREFKLSQNEGLQPGKTLKIKVRYEGSDQEDQQIFEGVIVKFGVESDIHCAQLNLELKDEAVKITSVPKNRIFRDLKEDQILKQIIENNGLEADKIDPISVSHQELVQYRTTDWDFLINRSEINARWVITQAGKINIIDPKQITEGAQHRVAYGLDNIHALHLEVDVQRQIEKASSQGWNITDQTPTKPFDGNDIKLSPGNLDPKELAKIMQADQYPLQSQVALSNEELQSWADGKMLKSRTAMVKGTATLVGNGSYQLLDKLTIDGINPQLNGDTLITGIRHRINTNGWETDLQLGLTGDWHIVQFKSAELPSGGLLPEIHGFQVGVVAPFEEDPDNQFRIKVNIPAFGEDSGPVWARLLSSDAGNERGYFVWPEPNDEVIVGFLNDDPRQAVVLGSVYSQNQAPPETPTEDNFIKGFFSREGIQVKIDDEKKALHLITSDKQSIILDEENKSIKIQDVNGNSLTLDENGISLKSGKDLTIEASGNVTIKGKKVDVN